MNAYNELLSALEEGEKVESVVFGPWGWGEVPQDGEWEHGYGEPGEETGEKPPVPFHLRGKVLQLEQAKSYMQNWSFFGGYGAPGCYSVYIHTNKRIFFVVQYDGSTSLCSVPRNPENTIPEMFGG